MFHGTTRSLAGSPRLPMGTWPQEPSREGQAAVFGRILSFLAGFELYPDLGEAGEGCQPGP